VTTAGPVVSADEVWSVVEEVWESLLGRTAVRADHAFGVDDAVTASIGVHGSWEGLVTFTCPSAAAQDVARRMLDLPDDASVDRSDVDDAVGEVANVLGGHVKALVARGGRLGLPRVNAGLVPVQAEPLCRTGVEWPGHVARVAVWRLADSVGTSDEGGAR
jgi:chemotaxis protein CheX